MSKSKFIENARAYLLRGIGVPGESDFVVDKFQTEAISSVVNGNDTLVVAPTGAGKTYIAVEAIAAYLRLGTKSVYTTPLKALSNTKYSELGKRFSPAHEVGLLTGDRKIDTDADVVVATTEIYRNELYSSQERFSLVVLDEVHYIADPQRGAVWEESIILTPADSTLLMLSASISNAAEIAEWLEDVRGKPCRVIIEKERPVELRYGFIHPDLGVIPLRDRRNRILSEIVQFYGKVGLNAAGTRLMPKRSHGRKNRRHGKKRSQGRSSRRRKK